MHELKIISCSSTIYKPSFKKSAVEVRAGQLQHEYLVKTRKADRKQGVPEGEVGRVETKLVSMGEVRGIVFGNFAEANEDTHILVVALAIPSRGKRGRMRGEEAERAIAVTAIRRRLSVMAVRCQARSLLGRLETLGPGGAAAAGRRWYTAELQRRWRQEEQAHGLAARKSYNALRTGFAMSSETQ